MPNNQPVFQFTCSPEMIIVGFQVGAPLFLDVRTNWSKTDKYAKGLAPYLDSGAYTVKLKWWETYLSGTRRQFRVRDDVTCAFSSVVDLDAHTVTLTGIPMDLLFKKVLGYYHPFFANPVTMTFSEKIVPQPSPLDQQLIMQWLFKQFSYGDIEDTENYDRIWTQLQPDLDDTLRWWLQPRLGYYPDFSNGFNYRLADGYALNEMVVADVVMDSDSVTKYLYEITQMNVYTQLVDMPSDN